MSDGERQDVIASAVEPARFGLTRGAVAAITTMVAVGIAVSLLPPLLALRLAERGVSERAIGLLVATIALASLCTTPFVSRIAGRFGTANVIATVTPAAAVLMIAASFTTDVRLLLPIIFFYGAAIALAFSLSEYWIATSTPDRRRGFVMGLYATVLSIGFAIGPAIVALAGADSIRPFLIGAALMGLSALPALAARGVSPTFSAGARHRFAAYIFAVPAATLGVFAFAIGESGGFAFLPLWGRHQGFGIETAALLASAMTLGNVAFQIPLGLLADRTDRLRLLLLCGLVGTIGMPLAWLLFDWTPALMLVLFVWGGATAGIYTIGLAHLASRFSGADLAGANAALVFCYALGMLIGPLVIGDAMVRAPITGFPVVIGLVFAAYSIIIGLRLARPR